MKSNILMLIALMVSPALWAENATFSYNHGGAAPESFGLGASETYNVAMLLSEPALIGKTVPSVSVPLDDKDANDCSAWLTKELKLKTQGGKKVNVADICTVEATVSGGVLTATFPEGVVVPEGGLYVGYTFTPNHKNARPVAVVDHVGPGCLWVASTSSQLKWADLGKKNELASAMAVTLAGDFPCGALAVLPPTDYLLVGAGRGITATIVNQGLDEISSVEYAYTVAGEGVVGQGTLPVPVPGKVGYEMKVNLPVPPADCLGKSDLTLAITGVNGAANAYEHTASGTLQVIPFIPVNRPLVEEYTGLDCAWCTRGYVKMEQMNLEFGSDFVGVAYHTTRFETGAMSTLNLTDCPQQPSGFPAASVSRGVVGDPSDIRASWLKARAAMPAGEPSASIRWAADDKTAYACRIGARFIDDFDGDTYKLGYTLVADSLSNPQWGQYNAYANPSSAETDPQDFTTPFWDLFYLASSPVYGLVFNDVNVSKQGFMGVEEALPQQITADEDYAYEFQVPASEIVNFRGEQFVNDLGKVRLLAFIIEAKSGKIVNAVSSDYADGSGRSGIENMEIDDHGGQTIYYDLTGQRIAHPRGGVFIKVCGGKAVKVRL